MKKFVISAAAVLTAAVMLTGCTDYGTDYPEEYKEFFDYTFDGDYKIELTEEGLLNEDTDYECGYRKWRLSYTDKNGIEHETELASQGNEKEVSAYGDIVKDVDMLAMISIEMSNIAVDEFYNELASEYFTVEMGEDFVLSYHGDGYRLHMSFFNPVLSSVTPEKNLEVIDSVLSPESGYKIADCDLKSMGQSEEVCAKIILTVESENEDPKKYVKKLKKLEKDYVKYVGSPQNYIFQVNVPSEEEDGNSDIAYQKVVLLGEETELAEDKSFSKQMLDALGRDY